MSLYFVTRAKSHAPRFKTREEAQAVIDDPVMQFYKKYGYRVSQFAPSRAPSVLHLSPHSTRA